MKTVIMQGADCATPLTFETAQALHSAGISVIARYLIPEKYYNHISKTEAQDITDNNIRIASVHETTGTTPKGGYANGVKDATEALECAINIGMPQGAAIYFAVDYQPVTTQDFYNISNYFIGVASVITTYKIGVYGCFDVIEWLARQNICKCYWQCMAWSFGKISDHATMYQKTSGRVIANVNLDLNDIYDDVGFWNCAPAYTVETITIDFNGIQTPVRRVLINNENYVRLRDLANADTGDEVTVSWDSPTGKISFNTKGVKA